MAINPAQKDFTVQRRADFPLTLTFKDGNGAVIEDYTTPSNPFTTTRREGQSPAQARARAEAYYRSLAEENILQKYRDART